MGRNISLIKPLQNTLSPEFLQIPLNFDYALIMMKHDRTIQHYGFPLNLQLRKINIKKMLNRFYLSAFFSFSHTPNDSRGQKTKKEITNDKKWVTDRTERKREKEKVEKKKEDRWTHKRTDRKERRKK